MTQAELKSIEDAGRSTMVWANDTYDSPSQLGDIAKALIPAFLILTAAAALLLALI
jgi:type IV secretory pathway component VirB8